MSLEHILLGMLRRSRSGYDLRVEFDQGTKHFWSAELSQIYPTLKRMEKRGWLTSTTQPSPRGPDRRVYERTAEGTTALHEWLRAGPNFGQERFAYVGQLIFMAELRSLKTTLSFLEQLRTKFQSLSQLLSGACAEIDAENEGRKLTLTEFHERMSLRMGVHSLQAKIKWCDESIRDVKQRLERPDTTP